jgi:hypothetical protein
MQIRRKSKKSFTLKRMSDNKKVEGCSLIAQFAHDLERKENG